MATQILHWYMRNAAVVFAFAVLGAIAAERTIMVLRRRRDRDEVATSVVSGVAFLVAKTVIGKVAILALSLYVYDRHRITTLDLRSPWVWAAHVRDP